MDLDIQKSGVVIKEVIISKGRMRGDARKWNVE